MATPDTLDPAGMSPVTSDPAREDCLWWQDEPANPVPISPLTGERTSEIVIVGGGFTGLWAAIHCKQLSPHTEVTLVEARDFGHGASGRNGGWLLGTLEGLSHYAQQGDAERPAAGRDGRLPDGCIEVLRQLIPDIARALQALQIDCELEHAGAIYAAAHYPKQAARAEAFVAEHQRLGFHASDFDWMSPDEVGARVNLPGVTGGVWTPHVGVLHPGKLLRGLVRSAIALGVRLHNNSPALAWDGRKLRTPQGALRYRQLLLATEGYGESLRPRHLLPVQSGMVATEPLNTAVWAEIGLSRREALCDFSRGSTYLQRTQDDRLIIGARGNYRRGGRCQHAFGLSPQERELRIALGRRWFPVLSEVDFPFAWGGSLAVPRDFRPTIGVDRGNALITAGGYLGEGVGASFLFGRTAAELMLAQTSVRTAMPWVRDLSQHPLASWEREPLPSLGFQSLMALYQLEEWAHFHNVPAPLRKATTGLCNQTETLLGL